ncbi:hypothetical protein FISHEDRAFT_70327 [Fistulina hepatica ATCC 64428]|uniref:Uncharacterized protein n=1 Tax=Fistulina hepatica ATCC 64428 TaxID=1128425 RepID=A0A0D7AJQ9_9AGAR|nr:hypothetical protein FISHEDRAFT_70327 [Fistulina hepatica ATCC 64428]
MSGTSAVSGSASPPHFQSFTTSSSTSNQYIDDTPIDWVIHPCQFHDELHEAYPSKRRECEWGVAEVYRHQAFPGEPKHVLLYVLAETATALVPLRYFCQLPGRTD